MSLGIDNFLALPSCSAVGDTSDTNHEPARKHPRLTVFALWSFHHFVKLASSYHTLIYQYSLNNSF